jgi:hypothetical protein
VTVIEVHEDPGGVLAAVEGLATAVEANAQDERLLVRRLRELREGRAEGRSWLDLLGPDERPSVLGLTGRIIGRLTDAGGRLRRALARGLRLEGATISTIAERFGVSHQRISALLRQEDRPPGA